jgi:N-ethylmaleimide reductase
MQDMKAAGIHAYGGPEKVVLDVIAPPSVPDETQVLVKVKAAGVNGIDWKIRDGLVKDAFPLPFPIRLGIEFVGEVIATGSGAKRFKEGDMVLGPFGGLGSYAEFIVVDEAHLAIKPFSISDMEAAALSISGLTAYQTLFEAGRIKAGQRVLIHGGAGGVGGIAVQLAHVAGAHVIATASKDNLDYVQSLGADEVFDYRTDFEHHIADIDFVVDLVGPATLDRLWTTLSDTGHLITTAAPDIESRLPAGRRGQWFRFHPDARQLEALCRSVAKNELSVEVGEIFAFEKVAAAIERNKTGHTRGKIVVAFHS